MGTRMPRIRPAPYVAAAARAKEAPDQRKHGERKSTLALNGPADHYDESTSAWGRKAEVNSGGRSGKAAGVAIDADSNRPIDFRGDLGACPGPSG